MLRLPILVSMAKKPEDYFDELAKVKPSPTGIKPIAHNRPKKAGPPIGLILLIIGGVTLYSFVHYFTKHDPKDAMASIVKLLPASAQHKISTELISHNLMSAPSTSSTSQQQGSAGIPAQRALAATRATDSQYVEIEGKWYKKTPDNVYMVNGHSIFYLDEHHAFRQPPPAPSTPARH